MIIEKETFYRRALLTAFWIRGCWGFFAWELVPFMLKLYPVVSLFFDALLVFIGISVMNRWRDRIFAIAFVAITGYTTCFSNHLSMLFFVNGLRDFISYLFIIPIFNYFLGDEERKKRTVPIFDRHLFVFLIVQAPCLIYQFLVHGACDWGGGSLGNTNSGIITTLIYAISFYLMQKRIYPDNVMKSIFNNKIYIFLLLPTFLNETKVGFIFMLLYFALLIPFNRKVFIRALMAIPLLVLLLVSAAYGYVLSTGGSGGDVFTLEYYTEMYLYDSGENSAEYAEWLFDTGDAEKEDIPRFSKLMLLEDLDVENPGHKSIGFGLGQFKGGTMVSSSAFYKKYEWMLIGSIPYIFHVYVQIGFIGVALMIWYFLNYFARPGSGTSFTRNHNVQIYLLMVFLTIMFYNDSIRDNLMMIVLTFISLSAWRDPEKDEADTEMPANKAQL